MLDKQCELRWPHYQADVPVLAAVLWSPLQRPPAAELSMGVSQCQQSPVRTVFGSGSGSSIKWIMSAAQVCSEQRLAPCSRGTHESRLRTRPDHEPGPPVRQLVCWPVFIDLQAKDALGAACR